MTLPFQPPLSSESESSSEELRLWPLLDLSLDPLDLLDPLLLLLPLGLPLDLLDPLLLLLPLGLPLWRCPDNSLE